MSIKKAQKTSVRSTPFENGQVWQMLDSSLRIELVGKRLVHYKHYSLKVKRPNVLLSNKAALERFLQKHRAILLPELRSLPLAAKQKRTLGPAAPGSRPAVQQNNSNP